MVASLAGGATLLFSCEGTSKSKEQNLETLITQQSDTLTIINSKNGKKDYRFVTPLMERYELARDPYMEFRYGVEIITYDTLGGEASSLVADYAIFYEKRELWEGRGNVVASGSGRTLYTQQLFWDQKTDKIYSNIDSKVEESDGSEIVGEGFESDSKFETWTFRETVMRMWVDPSNIGSGDGATTAESEAKPDADKTVKSDAKPAIKSTEKPAIKSTEKPASKALKSAKPMRKLEQATPNREADRRKANPIE